MTNNKENTHEIIEKLYDTYKYLLLRDAYSILKDSYLAEDAVQQTFIRLLSNISKINGIDTPETRNFLRVICRNVAINLYNRNKKIRLLENETDMQEEVLGDSRSSRSLTEIVVDNENVKTIINAINKLPVIYKDVIRLEKLVGCTTEEISKILGISIEAVRKRSQRARKILKKSLDRDEVYKYEQKGK